MAHEHLAICLAAACVWSGCDGPPPPPAETPERTAARVLEKARELEKDHETKRAFAAYREVAEQFPSTPEAKEAAEHIRKAQRQGFHKKKG